MENNGLITKIWGPPGWDFLNAVVFGYPVNPTVEERMNYMNFFRTAQYIFPCIYCKRSYAIFISEPDTEINEETFKNRKTLTRWIFNIHNKVNHKLGHKYNVTYEDFVEKYESYRAKCTNGDQLGCTVPLDYKRHSYDKYYNKDFSVIPIKTALLFVNYAKSRGLADKYFCYLEYVKNMELVDLRKLDSWKYRNRFCSVITQQIRINGTSCLEKDGEYEGLPTIDELKLILVLNSSFSNEELEKIYEKYKSKLLK